MIQVIGLSAVWILQAGKAQKRIVRTKGENSAGLKVEGLSGGERLILEPPADLKGPQRNKWLGAEPMEVEVNGRMLTGDPLVKW